MSNFSFQIISISLNGDGLLRKKFLVDEGTPIKIISDEATHVHVYGGKCSFGIVKNAPKVGDFQTKRGKFFAIPKTGVSEIYFYLEKNNDTGNMVWEVEWE